MLLDGEALCEMLSASCPHSGSALTLRCLIHQQEECYPHSRDLARLPPRVSLACRVSHMMWQEAHSSVSCQHRV